MNKEKISSILLSGFYWAFIGRILTAIFGIIINILIARVLEPEDVGAYFIVVSIVTILSTVSVLGQQRLVVRKISENNVNSVGGKVRDNIKNALLITLVSCIVISLILFSQGTKIIDLLFESKNVTEAIIPIIFLLIVRSFSPIFAEVNRGFHSIKNAVLYNGTIINIVFCIILLLLYFFMVNKYDLNLILYISFFAYFINLFFSIFSTRKLCQSLNFIGNEKLIGQFKEGLPFLITSISLIAYTQVDIWIVGMSLNVDEVALYGASVRLVQTITIPLLIVNAVIPSFISELYTKGEVKKLEIILRSSVFFAAIPSVLLLIIIFIFSSDILSAIYGEYYSSAEHVFRLISFGQFVNVICGSSSLVLMMTGDQGKAMMISLLSLCLMISLSYMFVGKFGIEGVAASVAFTTVLQSFILLFFVKQRMGIWTCFGFGGVAQCFTYFKNDFARVFKK